MSVAQTILNVNIICIFMLFVLRRGVLLDFCEAIARFFPCFANMKMWFKNPTKQPESEIVLFAHGEKKSVLYPNEARISPVRRTDFCLWGTKKMSMRFWQMDSSFAEQRYRFCSLFSLISSLEKVAVENKDKREERREKNEEYKKEKAADAAFSFLVETGGLEPSTSRM